MYNLSKEEKQSFSTYIENIVGDGAFARNKRSLISSAPDKYAYMSTFFHIIYLFLHQTVSSYHSLESWKDDYNEW